MAWLGKTTCVSCAGGVLASAGSCILGASGPVGCGICLGISTLLGAGQAKLSRRIRKEKAEPGVEELYSDTFEEASGKFRAAAAAAGAEYTELPVIDDLFIGVAVLAGDSTKLLLHVSGTHGVEGHAGSAIQLGLLGDLHWRAAEGPTVIFVHLLNPYGFRHCRRWNENNVDLNRNNLSEENWGEARLRSVGRSSSSMFDAAEEKASYDRMSSILDPADPTNSDLNFCVQGLLHIFRSRGTAPLRRVVTRGQFHNPTGIFFGGRKVEESHKQLADFFEQERWGSCLKVMMIDVHTGLGSVPGLDYLLCSDSRACRELRPLFAGVYEAERIEDLSTEGCPEDAGQAGGAYRDALRGSAKEHLHIFEGAHTLGFTQEFGTLSSDLVLRALFIENSYFQHRARADASGAAEAAALSRGAFFIETKAWKESVLSRGKSLFEHSLHWFK